MILIAETLLEVETLNAEEIDYLLKNRHMPEEVKEEVVETKVVEEVNPENILINEKTINNPSIEEKSESEEDKKD